MNKKTMASAIVGSACAIVHPGVFRHNRVSQRALQLLCISLWPNELRDCLIHLSICPVWQ